MSANPWMKFYPSDWRSDPRLRMCSLGARGLWMEMLALMHDANPYGHLLIGACIPSPEQLALLVGAASEEVRRLLSELEAAGVFSRTGKGVIYSRRMVEDEKKAKIARKNGKAGGNPNLCKTRDIPPPDNPPDKPHVNGEDKTQIPEARSQNKEGGGVSARTHEACRVVAGLSRLPETVRNLATVEGWLADGFDPERDIYPAVREVTATATAEVGSFAYFTKAIVRHHAARTTPKQESTNVHPIRPASTQRRGHSGRATGSVAQARLVAREFEIGDFDADGAGVWQG